MAFPPHNGNYSIWQSASAILQIPNFQTKRTIADYKVEYVSSADGVAQFRTILFPSGFTQEGSLIDTAYVYISLYNQSILPESLVQLTVSLIDVKGEKQLTQNFSKTSSQFEKDYILSRFASRASILSSAATYLHAGTLKVAFEVAVLKDGPSKHSSLSPLTSDYASLLATGALSDVTLLVGERAFPVHKLILSARSPVLRRMFSSSFKESTENQVVLEDVRVEVLQELLSFIYTERVENLEENASELLMVAEKYQIESLKKLCGQSLCATVSTDTLLTHLSMATTYNLPELKSKCLTFFAGHSKEIKLTAEWKQLIITEGNAKLLGLLLQSLMLTE